MLNTRTVSVSLTALMLVTGCEAQSPAAAPSEASSAAADASEQLNAWFDEQYEADLLQSPTTLTRQGRPERLDEWDDISQNAAQAAVERQRNQLAELRTRFSDVDLAPDDALSVRLWEAQAELAIDGGVFSRHAYLFHQMGGLQQGLPAFLMSQHPVESRADAEAYLTRLAGMAELLDIAIGQSQTRFGEGIHPPAFVYDYVLNDSRNIIAGAPFDDSGTDSPILADFKNDVGALELEPAVADTLIAEASDSLREAVGPAFERLITVMQAQQAEAGDHDGVWRLPDGEAYYHWLLRQYTTTDLTPQQIHDMGLTEVARIRGEMAAIRDAVGYDGPPSGFNAEFQREELQFPPGDAGRTAYLEAIHQRMDAVNTVLPDWFSTLPEAELEIRRVEAYREASSPGAFYEPPAIDGSRPGTYYINLQNADALNRAAIEYLLFHEAVPGHHLQISVSQELEGIPAFRRNALIFPYTEGWGLYAERLGKDMGFYESAFSDYFRLRGEMLRAVRLVVDTGIHSMRWSRAEANAYMAAAFDAPEGTTFREIDRYIVLPGQATAYFVGRNTILELRETARNALGDAFDIRGFHDAVLGSGPVPMTILRERVNDWVTETSASSPE